MENSRSVRQIPSADYAVISGPLRIGPAPAGLYLDDHHLADLAKLLRYAAERLDSGKASEEVKAVEPMVRRVLGWIGEAERANERCGTE